MWIVWTHRYLFIDGMSTYLCTQVKQRKDDLAGAAIDFDESIRLDRKLASAYKARGMLILCSERTEQLLKHSVPDSRIIKRVDAFVGVGAKGWGVLPPTTVKFAGGTVANHGHRNKSIRIQYIQNITSTKINYQIKLAISRFGKLDPKNKCIKQKYRSL